MNLHLDKEVFIEFIDNLSTRTGVATDIIEKDYYVCAILKGLASIQDKMQAYFKGGTAVYKIIDTMNRFSEDIDLTVKVISEQSNTQNRNRLKKSALGYQIDGLTLLKDQCIDNKGSVIGVYKYDTMFNSSNNRLYKAGEIQVEATSFTVSEPYQDYTIQPLVYELSNFNEKKVLVEKYNVSSFSIKIVKLERIFIDKVFAAEFYFVRRMYRDTVKHLYDITILSKRQEIMQLLNNKNELEKIIDYKRKEEIYRKGGISASTKIKDFLYLKSNFDNDLLQEFDRMQNKYVLNDKYKISIDDVKETLNNINNSLLIEY